MLSCCALESAFLNAVDWILNSSRSFRSMTEDAAAADSINNSRRALEETFMQGAAILTDMAQQRERLKATKRKVRLSTWNIRRSTCSSYPLEPNGISSHPLVFARNFQVLDVLSAIGLSDSLLRMIDRRQRLDAIIVYGGMMLVVLLLVTLWWLLKA